jgi:predicted metal-dependent HD superfamily phosphohydrolase
MHERSKRWLALWNRIGARGDGEKVYAGLFMRYIEPRRAYHTIAHIDDCLHRLDEAVRYLLVHFDDVEFALWFHDVVYDTHRHDNEERSVELAKAVARDASLQREFEERVANLILATKHNSLLINPDAQIIADIDLASLGYPEHVFEENTRLIRREYSWVPEDTFRAERAKILQAFLNRPQGIYYTQYFRDKYNTQAQQNLKRSIAQLLSPRH